MECINAEIVFNSLLRLEDDSSHLLGAFVDHNFEDIEGRIRPAFFLGSQLMRLH